MDLQISDDRLNSDFLKQRYELCFILYTESDNHKMKPECTLTFQLSSDFDQLQHVMTGNRNSDQITLGFACLDLTCLNMYNGRDDCIETNRAITRIILRSVNPGYCITTDAALVSGGASGLGGKERDRSRERFAQSQNASSDDT